MGTSQAQLGIFVTAVWGALPEGRAVAGEGAVEAFMLPAYTPHPYLSNECFASDQGIVLPGTLVVTLRLPEGSGASRPEDRV